MEKQIDTNRKRRFNIVDAVIVIVAALLIILLAKLFIGNFLPNEMNGTEISYTLSVKKLDASLSSLLTNGQSVFDSETGMTIGTVTDIEIRNSVYSEYDTEAGYYKNYEYPDLMDMTVTIKALCKADNSRFSVNGIEIVSGKSINVRTNTLYFNALISGINTQNITAPNAYSIQSEDSNKQ